MTMHRQIGTAIFVMVAVLGFTTAALAAAAKPDADLLGVTCGR